MSPTSPPPLETTRPSTSEAFPAEEGWVWCPEPFPLEGMDATWFWNADKGCFGLSVFTHRSFPVIGQVAVKAGLLPADSLDPEVATRKLDEGLHALVTLAAME